MKLVILTRNSKRTEESSSLTNNPSSSSEARLPSESSHKASSAVSCGVAVDLSTAWLGEDPSLSTTRDPKYHPRTVPGYNDNWYKWRERRISEIKHTLALKDHTGVELHRANIERLLRYYEHEAIGFVGSRELWVKHGRVSLLQPEGPLALREQQWPIFMR